MNSDLKWNVRENLIKLIVMPVDVVVSAWEEWEGLRYLMLKGGKCGHLHARSFPPKLPSRRSGAWVIDAEGSGQKFV